MTVNAVTQYLKAQFAGAVLGGQSVEPHVMPAPTQLQPALAPPRLYIWPQRINKRRVTMNGPHGFFHLQYEPMVLLLRETVNVDEASMETFVQLMDGVHEFMTGLGASGSFAVEDPETGEGSFIVKIGEEVTSAFSYPRRVQPPTVTLFCEFQCRIWEQING